ncbi:MAG TPA: GntR family transcriptional regulator [Anaerolineales bacterium]|nr:GntR family transcriptional regulator [Anaerolineae bacterium]HIQ00585.1 GntR family transcriptional regulator [Anaerolineales bacterium]
MDNTLRLDRRPLYAQAHDRLLALIQDGGLEAGDRLPSEATLADQLGISRATLREALRLLEEEGVIVRRQGIGTFVASDHHLESGLERLESVLALAARQGMETRVQDLSVDVVTVDRAVAERLGMDRDSPVTRVRRTILVEDRPVAFLEDLVPTRWLTPDALGIAFTGSVLDLLRQEQSLRIQEALANITAVRAGRSLAQRLGVQPDTALLLVEETLFDDEGRPVGFSRNYFVPERFRFHVVRR